MATELRVGCGCGRDTEPRPWKTRHVGESGDDPMQPVWKSPAWIAAVAALLTALVGVAGLFLTRDDEGAPRPTTVTPTGGGSVSAEVQGGKAPLTIGVVTESGAVGDSWTFPSGGAGPDDFTGKTGGELQSWLGVHGRIGLNQTLKLTIRGTADEPVVLTGMRALVEEASQPDAASSIIWTYGCGAIPVREARVDLEDPALRFSWSDESGELPKAPTLRVDRSDVEVVDVVGSVSSKDIAWRVILTYEFQGRSGEVVIDDAGRPFTVTSAAPGTKAYRVAPTGSDGVGVARSPQDDGKLGGYC